MSDRFDFVEFGDTPLKPPPRPEAGANAPAGTSWKPLRLRAVESIGDPGAGAGQFSGPAGIAVDRWGTLYVADSNNHRVQRITSGGDVYVIGRAGYAPGQMWGPQDVAIDPTGQYLYVAEQGNNRVQCFDIVHRQHLGAVGGMNGPTSVAFDAEGMLWIADTGNGRLLRLNVRKGEFIGGLDREAGIARPIAVACDGAQNLYVTEGLSGDVFRITMDGSRTLSLTEGRRLQMPRNLAVDAQGRIYLAEAGANRLHVFDAVGQSLLTFDTPSAKSGPFRAPAGVALGPNGEVYVADTLNHRILRLAWD